MQQQNRVTHSQFFYSRKLAKKKNNTKIILYLSTLIYLVIVILFSLCLVSFVFALVKLLDNWCHIQVFSLVDKKTFHTLPNFLHCFISNISIIYWILCQCYLIIHFLLSKCNYKVQRNHRYLYSIRIPVWIFVNKYFTK